MGQWSRTELETEFQKYVDAGQRAFETGDWATWAAQFTEDAHYVEHHYGDFHGRDAIAEWIASTMSEVPEMYFPVEWYIIDEERGWVVFHCWNQMVDPDGSGPYRVGTWTLLKYAGDGKWSYEEDMYNPAEFPPMLGRWAEASARASE